MPTSEEFLDAVNVIWEDGYDAVVRIIEAIEEDIKVSAPGEVAAVTLFEVLISELKANKHLALGAAEHTQRLRSR